MLETLASFAVSFLVSLLRGWLSDVRAASAQREAGAAGAIVEGRKQQDAALEKTRAAIDDSDNKPIEYRD